MAISFRFQAGMSGIFRPLMFNFQRVNVVTMGARLMHATVVFHSVLGEGSADAKSGFEMYAICLRVEF